MFWNQLCFLLPSPSLWFGHFARLSFRTFLPKTFTPLGDWLCSCPSPSDFVQPTLLLVTRTTPGSVSNSQKSWCQQKRANVGRCECWKTFNQGYHLFWEKPWQLSNWKERNSLRWDFRAGSMAEQTRHLTSLNEWKKYQSFQGPKEKEYQGISVRLNYLHTKEMCIWDLCLSIQSSFFNFFLFSMFFGFLRFHNEKTSLFFRHQPPINHQLTCLPSNLRFSWAGIHLGGSARDLWLMLFAVGWLGWFISNVSSFQIKLDTWSAYNPNKVWFLWFFGWFLMSLFGCFVCAASLAEDGSQMVSSDITVPRWLWLIIKKNSIYITLHYITLHCITNIHTSMPLCKPCASKHVYLSYDIIKHNTIKYDIS